MALGDCIAAVDQGTQSTRVIIYEVGSVSLGIIAVAQYPHKQIMTQAGCVSRVLGVDAIGS
jgi:glycerol kinase